MKAAQQYVRSRDVESRASLRKRVRWVIETVAWDWLYWRPMKLIGPDRASNVAGWLLRRVGPLTSAHRTARRNLRLAFPDWSEAQIRRTALAAWDSAGRTAGELPHLSRIDPYAPGGRVAVEGLEHLDAIRESGRGAVLISGHFANWEVMAAVICRRPTDCLVTYRSLNNPYIDRRLNRARHEYGIEVLTPKGLGTRELMTALASGRSVALMNDQKFREGVPVPFFGHEAMTAPGPARLAMKYDVPVLPVSTIRTGPARFCVTFHPPIHPRRTGDADGDLRDTVERITAFIEGAVRRTPTQWFWMHKRWPKSAWRESAGEAG